MGNEPSDPLINLKFGIVLVVIVLIAIIKFYNDIISDIGKNTFYNDIILGITGVISVWLACTLIYFYCKEHIGKKILFSGLIFFASIAIMIYHQPNFYSPYIVKELLEIFVFKTAPIIAPIIIIYILFTITRKICKKRQIRDREQRKFSERLKAYEKKYESSEQAYRAIKQLQKLHTNPKKHLKNFNSQITVLINKTKKQKTKLSRKEENKRKELIKLKRRTRQELKKQKNIKQKQFKKLLHFFFKKKSNESLPEWALNFDKKVIEGAQKRFNGKQVIKKYADKIRKEAKEFIQQNEAYPSNFQNLNKHEKKIYKQTMQSFKQGKLKPQPTNEKMKELLSKTFYHAKELEKEQREYLINNQKYKRHSCLHLNGKTGNNLIIKNDERKESDYHFSIKHLFAELDPKKAKVEYYTNGMRADVAFNYKKGKIAVEIETGTNNQKQIKQKTDWLNKNFDYWIFVTPKKTRKLYEPFTDNKKSFCLPLKDSSKKVKELIKKLQK